MRTARLSLSCTLAVPRSLRFVCVDFLVRMWRLNAWPRLIEPPGRTLNRLAADFFDFIFGTAMLLLITPPWRALLRLSSLPSAPWASFPRLFRLFFQRPAFSAPSPAPP